MNRNINRLLTLCAATLALLCFLSVYQPVRRQHIQQQREVEVKRCLIAIREAEEAFRRDSGRYCAGVDTLVARRYLPDSLQYIPFSDGLPFTVETRMLKGRDGKQTPLVECSAGFDEYLADFGKDIVASLTAKALENGQFPGLKFGDLDMQTDNEGNW